MDPIPLAQELAKFVIDWEFDGVDVDYEGKLFEALGDDIADYQTLTPSTVASRPLG